MAWSQARTVPERAAPSVVRRVAVRRLVVGFLIGLLVGLLVGSLVGLLVRFLVGVVVGPLVGLLLGSLLGTLLGPAIVLVVRLGGRVFRQRTLRRHLLRRRTGGLLLLRLLLGLLVGLLLLLGLVSADFSSVVSVKAAVVANRAVGVLSGLRSLASVDPETSTSDAASRPPGTSRITTRPAFADPVVARSSSSS
jgi:hypothetical protein